MLPCVFKRKDFALARQTCFGCGVNSMAHCLLARDALVVRDGALESCDALRHGEGATDDGHRCSSDGSERSDKDNLCKHFEKPGVDFVASFSEFF